MLLISTLLVFAVALITAGTAWYGAHLSFEDTRHRWIFGLCGAVTILLSICLAVIQYHESQSNAKATAELKAQITALVNATVTQASSAEIRQLRDDLSTGFQRIETALGKKPPSNPLSSQDAPPPVEHVRLTQSPSISDKEGAPFAVQAILQTDVVIQPAAFEIQCDSQIEDSKIFVAGQPVMMNVRERRTGQLLYFSFQYPPFTPTSPVVVILYSKAPIRVTGLKKSTP